MPQSPTEAKNNVNRMVTPAVYCLITHLKHHLTRLEFEAVMDKVIRRKPHESES